MKKLLSVLAAVGLTATASTAVVACTTKEVKAKQMDVKLNDAKDTLEFSTKKAIEVKLPSKVTKKIAKDTDLTKAVATLGGVFDKDGTDAKAVAGITLVKLTNTKEIKKDAKKATVKLTFDIKLTDAVTLGLVKNVDNAAKGEAQYAQGADKTVVIASMDKDGKFVSKIVKIDLGAKKIFDAVKDIKAA